MLKNIADVKNSGVVKGAPSGMLISMAFHAAAFLLAGLLIVFTVVDKPPITFVNTQPAERKKIKIKRPTVKPNKSVRPKAAERIVITEKQAVMPDIRLPELSGAGDSIKGGVEGIGFGPELSREGVTLFGDDDTVGCDFIGTFYDFKRTASGSPTPADPDNFRNELGRFVRSGLKPSRIARYYKSPKKLYATTFTVPAILSSVAPAAFGEPDTLGYCWMAHYKGQLVHKEDIRFRFWGMGDDVMVVVVDGEVVLNACWPGESESAVAGFWQSSSADSRKYQLGNNLAVVGDWIELKAKEPREMEVIIGEVPGGVFASMLLVQEDGVEYPETSEGAPRLPIFKTVEPGHELLDRIYETHISDQACITNGPVFNDLTTASVDDENQVEPTGATQESVPAPVADVETGGMRLWTSADGEVIEAEFMSLMGANVILKNQRGKQIRLPFTALSEEDRIHIELSDPPEFKISGIRHSSQRIIEVSPYNNRPPPRILEYNFGAKLSQITAAPYNHELSVEYFAVGQQYSDDEKYILLDRISSSFIPDNGNDRSHSFSGDTVQLVSYDLFDQTFGNKYYGYLVKLVDARGQTIQIESSAAWLEEHVENLEKLEPGWFFDKTCRRTFPSGPKRPY